MNHPHSDAFFMTMDGMIRIARDRLAVSQRKAESMRDKIEAMIKGLDVGRLPAEIRAGLEHLYDRLNRMERNNDRFARKIARWGRDLAAMKSRRRGQAGEGA
jgi:hypothetical protein